MAETPSVPAAPPRRCPICRRPADAGFRPFCSKRCSDIDLGRWLSETYRIPVTETETDADEEDHDPEEDDGR